MSTYHDILVNLLESNLTSKMLISYFADILKFKELSYCDVLYMIDNFLAYSYDCIHNEKRKYSNLDTIVRDTILKYHYINSYIDSIQADIEHIQEYISDLNISDSLYNKFDKLDDMLCDVIHELNETSL